MNGIFSGTNSNSGAELQRHIGEPCGYDVPTPGNSGLWIAGDIPMVRYDTGSACGVPCGGHAGNFQSANVHLLQSLEYKLFEISVHDMGRAIRRGCDGGRSGGSTVASFFRSIESGWHQWVGTVQQHRVGQPARGVSDDGSTGLPTRDGCKNFQ